jgi:hypothetical protein
MRSRKGPALSRGGPIAGPLAMSRVWVTALFSTLRVRFGPCRCRRSTRQRRPIRPHRVARSARLPGSGRPSAAIAAMTSAHPRPTGAFEACWPDRLVILRPPSTHPLGYHRPRIVDRDYFQAVSTRLVISRPWDVAAPDSARRVKPPWAGTAPIRRPEANWTSSRGSLAAHDKIICPDLTEVADDGSLRGIAAGIVRPEPGRSGQVGPKMVGRNGPARDPDRLGHRPREPQRQRHARANPASRRRARTAPDR